MRRGSILFAALPAVVGLWGLAVFPDAAEPGMPREILELPPLIKEALDRNPEVIAAREQVEAMKARVPQARALEDPELKIQLWDTPESLDVTRSARTIYGMAQRFPFPGTLSVQERIAAQAADQTAERLAAKELEVTAAVKTAYFELFYAHKAIEIHQEQVELLKRFFAIANAKFRVGTGTQVDVLKAQVELSTLLQRLPVLEQRKETAQAHVNTLLDRAPGTPLGVPRAPTVEPLRVSLERLEELGLKLRPELQEADRAIAEHESAVGLARLRYYPHLRVELQRWQNFNTDDGWGGNFTVNLPFSFWTKSKYDAGVREAAAEVGAAKARKRALENLTRFQVKDQVAHIRATERVVELYATTVLPQAEQTLEAASAGYRTGRTDFLDLIDAERALITYRLEYFRALVDLEQQRARLERVVGMEL